MIRLVFSLLAILAALAVTSAQAAEVQWFGQAADKITTPGGKVIFIDPFISLNPKTPEALKDLSKLGPVDLILVTHGHGDHVGDTVKIAEERGAKVAMNADMGQTFMALDLIPKDQLIRFNKTGPIQPMGDGITVTMVRAEHSSELVFKDPADRQETRQARRRISTLGQREYPARRVRIECSHLGPATNLCPELQNSPEPK